MSWPVLSAPVLSAPVLSAHCLDPAPIPARPAAARAGGFDRIGLSLRQLREWLDAGGTLAELDRELLRHGVVVAELEALTVGDEPGWREELALELTARYGVRYVQAIAPAAASRPESLATLCERLPGLTVGVEPLPWTAVPDVAAAATLVEVAGHPRAGVCLDTWHHFRHGGDLDGLRPHTARIVAVQLSDGVPEPGVADPLTDCLDHRLPPGEGTFPLAEVLDLAPPGVHLALEVLSADLRARPPEEIARRLDAAVPARSPDPAPAIGRVLAAAARLADERRPDELAALFTDDCRVSYSPGSTAEGRAGLRDYLRAALGRYAATSHLLGLPEVTADGPDAARSVTTVQAWHRRPDDGRVVLHGRYVDRWRRTPAGWRIAERRLEVAGAEGRDVGGFHLIDGDRGDRPGSG